MKNIYNATFIVEIIILMKIYVLYPRIVMIL